MMGYEVQYRPSLLELLVDRSPGAREVPPRRAQRLPEMIESVRRDLEWLLSTRCRTSMQDLDARGRTILDVGLVDLTHLNPVSEDDRVQVERALRECLAACEPRLQRVRVTVAPHPEAQGLWATIEATLVTAEVETPVSFPFVVLR